MIWCLSDCIIAKGARHVEDRSAGTRAQKRGAEINKGALSLLQRLWQAFIFQRLKLGRGRMHWQICAGALEMTKTYCEAFVTSDLQQRCSKSTQGGV